MKRIVVLYTDGDSREDGNVFYTEYVIVESNNPALKFQEPLFGYNCDPPAIKCADFIAQAKALGYIVEEPETIFVCSED